MAESDESGLWKYLELPQEFQRQATEIDVTAKTHLRIIERLAKHIAKQKPKTPQEFERVEYLKDFCIKGAQLNEQVVGLLGYLQERLNELYADYKSFADGANLNRVIRDQGERLEAITKERDQAQKELNELKRASRAYQANS